MESINKADQATLLAKCDEKNPFAKSLKKAGKSQMSLKEKVN
jgi:hypothetical protein